MVRLYLRGYYFLFYFRDYSNIGDIYKKIAFTLKQGSPKILEVTLADDTEEEGDSDIERLQEYWSEHYREYKSQIKHIQEVSKEEKPEYDRYEIQKENEAKKYFESYRKEYTLRKYFTYNESTGRYDSNNNLDRDILQYLVEDGEFTVPIGIINGSFECSRLRLKTLKNGPTEVTRWFDCHSNQLTTLEYAPKKVGRSFYCYENALTTLKGAPKYVGEDFFCYKNNLKTLEGAPEYVGDWFDCWGNPLQSKELSTKVKGRISY